MALIEKEAVEIKQVEHQLHTKSMPPISSTFSSSSSSSIDEKSKMVGGVDLVLELKDKLTSNRLALQIIPIVGMGGSGMATLARNIYQDLLIREHFHICAWVTISQEFRIREILVQLLEQLDKVASQDSSEGDLGLMLHQHLFGRSYLIILDDMWNIEAWERVMISLPNNENGSRIVVTTRLSNLASELPNSRMLEMKLEEIPLEFADITTLGVIDVWYCADSVVVSIKRRVKERDDIYGEEESLQVYVTIMSKNEALQSSETPKFRITCTED